ncbi:MAG: autotransporter-associated beta strand repeat-containing protein [Luteolibacter sp.]|uniref:beta strand repeat-containing protein n=1 Tax=Luteolibacter sp. TaxID=1962973 RepID=UPI0032672967
MKLRQSNLQFLTVCLAPALIGLALPSAHAASATWTGGVGGTATSLSSGANWSSASATFASGDVATFDNTTALGTLTWNTNIGPSFGATDGLHVLYTGNNNLTLDGITGAPGLQWGVGNITINSGAGAFSFGDGLESTILVYRGASNAQTYTNNSSNTATFAADILWRAGGGAAKTVTLDGSGNWLFNAPFRIDATQGQTNVTVIKNGAGTVNFTASNNLATTPALTLNGGTLRVTAAGSIGAAGSYSGTIANNATFSYESSANQTISGVISGAGVMQQTAGTLILSGANTYTAATTINGGTLNVGGTGSIESSSSVNVNGSGAKYLHTSTTASTRNITLTNGTVAGTGTLGAVTVGNGTGIIANGNGNSAAITLGSLAFNGAAAITVTDDGDTSTSGIIVSGALSTTPANGSVTINASNAFWNGGSTYNLVSTGSFGGSISNFTKGTITGLTSRQSASLVLNGSTIGLLIGGDSPKWAGLDNSNWVVGTTGTNGNWKLLTGGIKTDYIQGDVVRFDDSPTNTTVTISAANVSPAVVNFANSSKNYIINGAFGIAGGTIVNKDGSANVTISTTNTYTGGTNISGGTVTLSGAGTLGAAGSALSITSGTLNLGGTSSTVNALAINGDANIVNGTLNATGLTATNTGLDATISSALDLGSGNLSKSGDGLLTINGSTSYTGTTAINGGTLVLGGAATLSGSSGITLGGGALDLGGTTQTTNAITIGAGAPTFDVLLNGTIMPTAFNVTNPSGTVRVSANITGPTGIAISAGSGILSLTGTNDFTGPLNFTAPATVTIDDGSNTGGGPITYNSFGTTFTINKGTYLTSGISANGLSEFRTLNLNGGVLESTGDIFANTLAISININGGTLRSGNFMGITVFDYNNLLQVNGAGATFDTTAGGITVGNNADMIGAGNAHVPTVNQPKINGTSLATLTLLGGNSLVSGITNTGHLDIQDNSIWDINGIASSLGGLSGNGSVISSPGAAVLTINFESFSGPYTYSGTIGGGANVSIVKNGGGTQILTGTNTYGGDTTVAGGILSVDGDALPNAGKLVINGGVVEVTGTEVVAYLFFGAVQQATGTWGATGSGATHIDDTHFTGSGVVSVVAPAGYNGWATTNAGGEASNLDSDSDGVRNGVEYFMNSISAFTASPALVNIGGSYSITWPNGGNIPASAYGTQFVVQTSTNLANWSDVPIGNLTTNTNSTLKYTLSGDGKSFVRLVVTPE